MGNRFSLIKKENSICFELAVLLLIKSSTLVNDNPDYSYHKPIVWDQIKTANISHDHTQGELDNSNTLSKRQFYILSYRLLSFQPFLGLKNK